MKTNGVPDVRQGESDSPRSALRSSIPFPRDLRVWLKHSALLRATQGIAQETDIATLRPVFSVCASRFHHPWRMLTLVTYAYAIGLSEDCAVAAIAAVEPDLCELFRGEAPSAATVRRFRNHNRNVISSCLGKVIRHVWCHQHDHRMTALHPVLIVDILCDARARVQRARADPVASEPACLPIEFPRRKTTHARV